MTLTMQQNNTPTIEEGNVLIVEFMGHRLCDCGKYDRKHYKMGEKNRQVCDADKLEYHSSWDWLMPVVERIHLNRNVHEVSIKLGSTRIWFQPDLKKGFIQSPHKPENPSIMECWFAVVEFIQWYNKHGAE